VTDLSLASNPSVWLQVVKIGVIVLVQLCIALLRSPISDRVFHNLSGTQKLSIISGLTFVLGIPVFKSIGLDVGDSLFQSLEAISLAVLGHQTIQNVKQDVKS
jgi:hypothetical protein